ncbi:MAG: hypothetical protein N2255_05395, partial [Kiritimatiellae bacterium]|nr:hypothetical protein [Kiritimatiellia bacterium]
MKALWAEISSQGLVIRRSESLRLPAEGTDRSAVILPWLGKVGIGRDPCVIGLPARQAMFQPFVLTAGDPRTPRQAAAMEVIRFTELASEEMTYDFSPFSLESGEKRILLAMARPSALAEITGFARQAGLELLDIIPTPVAMYHALMPQV